MGEKNQNMQSKICICLSIIALFTLDNGKQFFKKILFIYLRERVIESINGVEGEEEADFPLSREPNAGFHPKTPGS